MKCSQIRMVTDQSVLITSEAASEWKAQLKSLRSRLHQQLCSIFLPKFCFAESHPCLPSSGTTTEGTRAGRQELCPSQWLLATCGFAATTWNTKKRSSSLPTAGNGTNLWIRSRVAGVNLFALWIRTLRPTLEWRKTNQRSRRLMTRSRAGGTVWGLSPGRSV